MVELCAGKLSVGKLLCAVAWCLGKLCVGKLCARKLCVGKLLRGRQQEEAAGGGGGRRRRRQEEEEAEEAEEVHGSAPPKTRTPHKHVWKYMYILYVHVLAPLTTGFSLPAMLHVLLKCARLQHQGRVRKTRACGTWSVE